MTLPSPSKEEDAIIKVLRKRWSHVSAERVLSGAGLVNFYEALCTMRAFSHFCAFLGSAAGDLALTFGATGAYTSPAGYCCGSRSVRLVSVPRKIRTKGTFRPHACQNSDLSHPRRVAGLLSLAHLPLSG